jgi:hypothetical protein
VIKCNEKSDALIECKSTVFLGDCIKDVTVVAVGTKLVCFYVNQGGTFEEEHVLPEHFLAKLTGKDHIGGLFEYVITGLVVAVRTVEPFFAARGTDSRLNVQNMLAHRL